MSYVEDCHPTPKERTAVDSGADSSAPIMDAAEELPILEQFLCPVDEAARIIGQKWTLQIVHELLDHPSRRFCELQEALGGVNPSTLSSRLKMLEEEGLVHRVQISAIPPHVEYSLTEMGRELHPVIHAVTKWSNTWLCGGPCCAEDEAAQRETGQRDAAVKSNVEFALAS